MPDGLHRALAAKRLADDAARKLCRGSSGGRTSRARRITRCRVCKRMVTFERLPNGWVRMAEHETEQRTMKHPMQPIVVVNGVYMFQENAIVRALLDFASARGMDMNRIACMPFGDDDRNQFAQLIGYSVSGHGDLSYADPETVAAANAQVDAMSTERKD